MQEANLLTRLTIASSGVDWNGDLIVVGLLLHICTPAMVGLLLHMKLVKNGDR